MLITSRRQVVLMVLGWLGVVGVAAALTFAVVDAAGRQVGQPLAVPPVTGPATPTPSNTPARPQQPSLPPVTTTPDVPTSSAPATVSTPPVTTGHSTTHARVTPRPAPHAVPPPVVATPLPAPAPSTPRASSPANPPDQARPSSPAAPTAHAGTFRTEGGTVTVSCQAAALSLTSIVPQNGWRFQQESHPGQLDVAFTNGERDVELTLTCVNGTPHQLTS